MTGGASDPATGTGVGRGVGKALQWGGRQLGRLWAGGGKYVFVSDLAERYEDQTKCPSGPSCVAVLRSIEESLIVHVHGVGRS